jgi:glycosyltransferase involved in cell wall biosynthesis
VEYTTLRVTAIVPTCERPVLLERALQSIAAQEFAPAEIIVVDDAGGGHEAVTRRAVERSDIGNVHVIANSRAKGVSGARNAGAELGTGELLAFLDDDDEWLPSYLRQAVALFNSADLDVVCTDLLCRFDDGVDRQGKAAPSELRPELFLARNPGLIGSNLVIRRSLYRTMGGFDESLPTYEDMDCGIRLSLAANVRYARLPQRLVRRHEHTGPKLTTVQGEAMRNGIRRFYETHGPRMSETQRQQFRTNVRHYWGIDEQGHILNLSQTARCESLMPMLKTRLDQQRHRKDP